jgi:hypothetical protein
VIAAVYLFSNLKHKKRQEKKRNKPNWPAYYSIFKFQKTISEDKIEGISHSRKNSKDLLSEKRAWKSREHSKKLYTLVDVEKFI